MARLVNRYAAALLAFAQERGELEKLYRQAQVLLGARAPVEQDEGLSDEMTAFIHFTLKKEVRPVLTRFLDMAREHMDIAAVEVVSAVSLTPKQLADLELRLIRFFQKQVEITVVVDSSLIGGLRIISGDMVMDTTIRTQLQEMKKSVYKGVYIGR